jgi:hypothetical protein
MQNLPALVNPLPVPQVLPQGQIRVAARAHPFREEVEEYWFEAGPSLQEILVRVQPEIAHYAAHVWIEDDYILPEDWPLTYPQPKAGAIVQVSIKVVPQGPVGRIIGMVVVTIAAIAASVLTYGALAGPAWGAWAGVMGGLAGMAVGIVGNMALTAMFPVTANAGRQAALMGTGAMTSAYGSSVSSSPTYSLNGGSNQANLWGPISKIFGIHKHFPGYGAEYYTEISGDEQYLIIYFVWCLSRAGAIPGVQIEDLMIGATGLEAYEDVTTEHHNLRLHLKEQTIAIDVAAKTLRRAAGSWRAAGLQPGTLNLGGCTTEANNTAYLISEVTDLVLTYTESTATTSEAGTGAQTATMDFGDDPPTLYTNSIHEESFSNLLLEKDAPVVRTSKAGPRKLSVDISLPSLFANDPVSGARGSKSVFFKIEYCESGTGAWQTVLTPTISAASSSAVRRGFAWEVNAGADPDITYDVRLTRTNPGPDDTFSSSISYWTTLRSIWATEPFNCPVPVAKTIMRIKASNELNGTVDKFSGIASGMEPDWDAATETWPIRITQNPASHLREMFQGPQNQEPYTDGEIHLERLQYWHAFCAEDWEYNKIVDYDVDFEEILAEIAAAGRASMDYLDSKRSVIIGEPQEYLVGPAFTPRNSKNFSSQITYPAPVHCWRCAFKNELNDWADDERLVLQDGYALLDANGDKIDAWGAPAPDLPLATIFVSLPILGVTHPDLIFRHARFHGAQLALQFEKHQWEAHPDALVARRGNRTKFASPVILAGLAWGRVKARVLEIIGYEENGDPIYSGNLAGVTVDAKCPMQEGVDYAIRFRLGNNVSVLCPVATAAGEVKELTFITPIPPYDPGPPPVNYWPAAGDLFMFGEEGKEAIDLLLSAIQPNAKLGARVSAVEYNEAIYTADQGVIPPHDPQITIPPAWWTPEIAWVRSNGTVLYRDADGTLQSRILVSLAIPGALNANITGVEAQYWVTASGATPVTRPLAPLHDFEVSLLPVEDGASYDFRLRYVRKDGSRGPWTATQTHVVEGKTAPPENVIGFNVYQIQSVVKFSWTKNPDQDIAGYELRYGAVGIAWDDAMPLPGQEEGEPTTMDATSFSTVDLPPGTMDYLIKAIDTSGNYSLAATRKQFKVMNFYEILLDDAYAPLWPGTLTNYVRNPLTGNLNPADQALANENNFDLFNHYVVNPYSTSSYEPPEIDMAADISLRAWSRIYSQLGPGEGGVNAPTLYFDYKPAAGAYAGFAEWTIGSVVARYLKFKLTNDNTAGLVKLTNFQPVLDKIL